MAQLHPGQNNLGISGWFWAGRYRLERYLYILHRVTGLGILFYLIIHLVATTIFRVQGQPVWESMMEVFHNPWFKAGEYIVCVAFLFHALNGLRLTFQRLGFGLGRPGQPVYPYKDSLRKNRVWTIALVVIFIILAVIFLVGFITGS